jgi:mRNA-degrading endonuclease RelE of RelBE toxin-antitoxin system
VFGAEKLTGIDAYKLRVGSYRIVYEINDVKKEVRVVMVEDRKQVYQRLRRKK